MDAPRLREEVLNYYWSLPLNWGVPAGSHSFTIIHFHLLHSTQLTAPLGRPVKLLLVFVSTVILGFQSRRDPSQIFVLSWTCTCFEVGLPLPREEESLQQLHSKSKLKSKLCYDRRSVGQSVLVSSTHLGLTKDFYYCQTVAGLLMWDALSDDRKGLPFTIAASPHQRSHFWDRGTRDHILLSQIRDSRNLEGQVPVFISPRNRVARLYPQALGSLFVAFYDSQGYSGGIRTRLHAEANNST
jgi:hypothetical protein